MISPIIFTIITLASFYFFTTKMLEIKRNVFLGKGEVVNDNAGERFKNMMLIAFGQKKMFKRWIPATLHFFIYAAFMITQIELIEIFIDGFFGQHRFLWHLMEGGALAGLYAFVINFIEILSVLAFVATFAFLSRRNLLKIPRFHKPEMNGWPKLDGNIILYLEIVLLICIFTMNSTDLALQQMGAAGFHETPQFLVSSMIAPMWSGMSAETLMILERIGWWGHILTVFAFLNYLPISKHLHIMLAFPNVYFKPLKEAGEMDNMPGIQKEVASMFSEEEVEEEEYDENAEIPKFGASDVTDLKWKNILDAYTCTECGRCTSVCPANLTGKKLSPRKIMMDVRDRAEEIGKNLDSKSLEWVKEELREEAKELTPANYGDGKSLFDFITHEELHACTTCNACVEACPVTINPLDIITQMRRHLILDIADAPNEWNTMFTNIENSGSPWQFSPDDRANWINE